MADKQTSNNDISVNINNTNSNFCVVVTTIVPKDTANKFLDTIKNFFTLLFGLGKQFITQGMTGVNAIKLIGLI